MTRPPEPEPTKVGEATDELASMLYLDMRRIARSQVRRLPKGATLQATALVHEAYLRLSDSDGAGWSGRNHFLAAAARAMRRIVVEHARQRLAGKRGGGMTQSDNLDELPIELGAAVEDLLALDSALDQLEEQDARQAMIVMLRYFVGLQDAEIADVVGVSQRTVRRDWQLAKLFLARLIVGKDDS